VPARHRSYARYLLASIVASQRWGIPPEVPTGWKVFFKGGWSTGTGRVTHQVARLEKGGRRLSVAVMTEYNPSHEYGTRTIRGVATRLLRTPLP
jgi:beta-lactamase class A